MEDSHTIPSSDRRAADYGATFTRLKQELELKKRNLAEARDRKDRLEAELERARKEHRQCADALAIHEKRVSKARKRAEAAERPVSWYFMKAVEKMCVEDGTMQLYNILMEEAENLRADEILDIEFGEGERRNPGRRKKPEAGMEEA